MKTKNHYRTFSAFRRALSVFQSNMSTDTNSLLGFLLIWYTKNKIGKVVMTKTHRSDKIVNGKCVDVLSRTIACKLQNEFRAHEVKNLGPASFS